VIGQGRALAAALAVLAASACGKTSLSRTTPSAGGTPASSVSPAETADIAIVPAPMTDQEGRQWAAAKDGDSEELMRLEDLVGCEGLRERAAQPDLRSVAIRAMEYCGDFSQLPWLAELGGEKNEGDARSALDAIVAISVQPRRAVDAEDAEELHEGCGTLLALAKASDQPKQRRVLAIRAMRMLADRGCAKPEAIPTDLDTR
jgi:hypothetical protein